MAVVLDAGWLPIESREFNVQTVATLCIAVAGGYVHLIRAPLRAHRLAQHAVDNERSYEHRLSAVARRPNASASAVVVIRASYPSTVLWAPFMLRDSAIDHWWTLSQTFEQSTAIRTGLNSLELVQDVGPLFPTGATDFFRVTAPGVGQVTERPGIRMTVTRVDAEGRPKPLRFEFDRDLDAPSLTWITKGNSGFTTVQCVMYTPRSGQWEILPPGAAPLVGIGRMDGDSLRTRRRWRRRSVVLMVSLFAAPLAQASWRGCGWLAHRSRFLGGCPLDSDRSPAAGHHHPGVVARAGWSKLACPKRKRAPTVDRS